MSKDHQAMKLRNYTLIDNMTENPDAIPEEVVEQFQKAINDYQIVISRELRRADAMRQKLEAGLQMKGKPEK